MKIRNVGLMSEGVVGRGTDGEWGITVVDMTRGLHQQDTEGGGFSPCIACSLPPSHTHSGSLRAAGE